MAEFFKTCLMGAVLLTAFCTGVRGQVETVDRTASGQAGKDIRVGVYVNVRPDCTSGPLPAIRLSVAPEHGSVTVKKASVSATNYKQCLALQVQGFVAFYRSRPDFRGIDVLNLEIKFPGGRTEIQRISVNIGNATPGQGI
jgi:hypothetical protein